MKVGLVSANFGGIDVPKALPPLPGEMKAHYYSDRLLPEDVRSTWTTATVLPPGTNPRLSAKMYKCQVYRFAGEADAYIWADAAFRFLDLPFFVNEASRLNPDEGAFIPHPFRATAQDEYMYVLRGLRSGSAYLNARYTIEAFEREFAHFRRRGHRLDQMKLWSGGLWILRHGPKTVRFLDSWWKCVQDFSVMDQPAIAPLLAEADVRARVLNIPLYRSPYHVHEAHQ